uniref:Grh/CP2 DB domain-containing protein n=1 Tax=Oncorhynchus tshawytscha TaxID=74940 RepID=A0A8C8ISK7_ONCTS
MTQELAKKRGVLVFQNEASYSGGRRQALTEDDEDWRAFLGNPLTAASKAMMHINGDEDSANALLYNYYKVRHICLLLHSVEVGSLHTLRLESLKLVFQPHHKFLVNKLYSSESGGATLIKDHVKGRMADFSTLPARGFEPANFCYWLNEYSLPLSLSQHFEYMLEAPQSLWTKSNSGQMSYLNKAQFYPITLRALGGTPLQSHLSGEVRSVVMLVFGEEKLTEDQLKYWKYWHSRQHTAKQRCIDIADYKERFNTIANIEEIAYNAISFTWDTKDEPRVFVSVNCLSTDFSPQKGVRGLPLNLQIDTYSFGSHGHKLVHRAYCMIKVFCDKGAERKIRDEERKQPYRKGKRQETTAAYVEDPLQLKHVAIASFKAMSDMDSQPVLFIPEVHFPSTQHHHVSPAMPMFRVAGHFPKRLLHCDEDFDLAPHKKARRDGTEKVLLYVRKETEEVFDALMLKTPTLAGLLEAVTDKYELPLEKMGKVYKRCKKGILVHMDDNIIKHYSNEDAFQINMEEVGGEMLLTLTEI